MEASAFLDIAAEVFGVDRGALSMDSKQDEIAEWDSLAHLNLLMQCSDASGVELNPDRIAELLTFTDVFNYFNEKD